MSQERIDERIDRLSRSLADATSRRGVLRLFGVGVAGTAITAVGLNEALAKPGKSKGKGKGKKKGQAKQQSSGASIGPFGSFEDIPISAHQQGRNFKGLLTVNSFELRGDAIVALATLTGKVTGRGVGNKPVSEDLVLPVSFSPPAAVQAQATCEILDLVLGPIDLTLLGLRLQVNQIHIQLTAQQGGGLLGDLLCAIAGLLSGGLPGFLGQIVIALNQILAILRGL